LAWQTKKLIIQFKERELSLARNNADTFIYDFHKRREKDDSKDFSPFNSVRDGMGMAKVLCPLSPRLDCLS